MSNESTKDSNDIEKDWTIMVYMAGDNNLSENVAVSLDEVSVGIREIIPPDISNQSSSQLPSNKGDINVLVFFDGNSLTAPTKYIDFSNGSAESVEYNKNLEHYPINTHKKFEPSSNEGDSASAYSIMNFVHWCIHEKKRLAKNYAIIFSGHSFGFHGTSFLRDESSGGFITLFRFRWALENVIKDCFDGKKISILGFDSCVMSMLEVGVELEGVAQTIIASEGSLPNSGWSYSAILKRFIRKFKKETESDLKKAIANPEKSSYFIKLYGLDNKFLLTDAQKSITFLNAPDYVENSQINIDEIMNEIVQKPEYVREMSKDFVTNLINHHNNLLIGGRSIDVAAWNLEKVRNVALKLNLLAKELNDNLSLSDKIDEHRICDNDIIIFHELKKILLQCQYDAQTYMNEQCIDLKDFCKRLIIECMFLQRNEEIALPFSKLIGLSKDLIESIDDCVIKSGFSGDEYQYSNGISIFFPWSHITFELTNYRYRYLRFAKGNRKLNDEKLKEFKNYKGVGKQWYFFLANYLYRVTLRGVRVFKETVKDEKGNSLEVVKHSSLDDFSKSNPVWSKSNPIWSKSNPIWSRSNPDSSRSNPPWSKSNPDSSRSNPDSSRSNPPWSKGEMGNYLFYFSRFKNFENKWDVCGFADEFPFEKDFDEADKEITSKKDKKNG